MSAPLAIDLFCGAGGVSTGLARAGFRVVGVDIEAQPSYPFAFVRGDALAFEVPEDAAFVWASPPCQAFTAYKRRPNHVAERPNLIPAVRAKLRALSVPWVIENVPGAPLVSPVTLCGSMFGLDVRRHRLFEASFPVSPPRALTTNRRRASRPPRTGRTYAARSRWASGAFRLRSSAPPWASAT